MGTPSQRPRRPLSRVDRAILVLHGLVAAAFGVVGFVDVDPDWAGLQRTLIVMLVGLWAGGIVATAVIARLVTNAWIRTAVLLAGPFAGIAVLVGSTVFGAW